MVDDEADEDDAPFAMLLFSFDDDDDGAAPVLAFTTLNARDVVDLEAALEVLRKVAVAVAARADACIIAEKAPKGSAECRRAEREAIPLDVRARQQNYVLTERISTKRKREAHEGRQVSQMKGCPHDGARGPHEEARVQSIKNKKKPPLAQ